MPEMIFESKLPFDFCAKCTWHELQVRVNDLYEYSKIIVRKYDIYCENEPYCRNIKNMLEAQKTSPVMKT